MADEISGELTLSLDILHVTTTGVSAEFDSRCPICATEANMKYAAMVSCAKKGLSLKDQPMRPPHHVPAESPFIQTLLGAYEKYTGVTGAKPIAIGGGTYLHHIEGGVSFGCEFPGYDYNMHGADEYAIEEQLLLSSEMYAAAIVDICG